MHPDTPVVILCGGQGTRIREASESLPKAMVEIGGRPIVWHIMKIYRQAGFRRFVLCLGYKSWAIKEYFLDYRARLADFTLNMSDRHSIEFHNGVDEDWQISQWGRDEIAMRARDLRWCEMQAAAFILKAD